MLRNIIWCCGAEKIADSVKQHIVIAETGHALSKEALLRESKKDRFWYVLGFLVLVNAPISWPTMPAPQCPSRCRF